MKVMFFLVLEFMFIGCKVLGDSSSHYKNFETKTTTLGSDVNAPNYGYTPIDPLPAYLTDNKSTVTLKDTSTFSNALENISGDNPLSGLMPHETMRMAIGKIDLNGNVSFTTSSIGYQGSNYIVIMDYVKASIMPMSCRIILDPKTGGKMAKDINVNDVGYNVNDSDLNKTVIPIYVGVGLRIIANIKVIHGSINLGNFLGIGLNASSNNITGTLIVQTLGISGKDISPLIPMPGELNSTTIQNAILSLGEIKAKMYEPSTILTPCVLAYYNNVGGNGTILTNSILSLIFSRKLLLAPIPYFKVNRNTGEIFINK